MKYYIVLTLYTLADLYLFTGFILQVIASIRVKLKFWKRVRILYAWPFYLKDLKKEVK